MAIRLNADQLAKVQAAVDHVDAAYERSDGLIVGGHKIALEDLVVGVLKVVFPTATVSILSDDDTR